MKGRFSVALGFLALIAVGAVVLAMPWMRTAGTWGDPMTAAFTACSAVCVTGLTVVDIAREFTFAGQVALLVLVQLGCVGLMTLGTFIMVAIGRRLSLAREFSLMNAYGVAEVRGLRGLICWVVGSMLFIEGIGATALYFLYFHDVWLSIFYSAMSFCNAGFSILPNSLATLSDAPLAILAMGLLTVVGGIGFLVIYNLCTFKFLRRSSGGRGRLTLHSKVVLRFTLYLILFAFATFLILEWNGALSGFPPLKKFYVALYQAITPRTCGFSIVPTEGLKSVTRIVYESLMFIGGGPGSAAAGMKITTFAVLIYTIIAMCRGENETAIYKRTVPMEVVRESLVIVMVLVCLQNVVVMLLLQTEGGAIPVEDLTFEVFSAITTTGLSVADTTARLTPWGKGIIMLTMFVGRLGALAIVMMIGDRETQRHVRYPSEELVVG